MKSMLFYENVVFRGADIYVFQVQKLTIYNICSLNDVVKSSTNMLAAALLLVDG